MNIKEWAIGIGSMVVGVPLMIFLFLSLPLAVVAMMRWFEWEWWAALIGVLLLNFIPGLGQLAQFVAGAFGAYFLISADLEWEKAVRPQQYQAVAKMEKLYLEQLRGWIKNDGRPETVQDRVIAPCSKLVILTATKQETTAFLAKEKMEEYDFRASFCMKATIHQKFPQPEFQNDEMIKKICSGKIRAIRLICETYHLD